MKKILFIANYRKHVGGIAVQMDILKERLTQEGYIVDIFSTKGNPWKRIVLLGRLLVCARQYDILHIHGCSGWGMLPVVCGIIAGKIWQKRTIVTYHGGGAASYLEHHHKFAQKWLNRADEVIVLSGFLEEIFTRFGIKNVVIPNVLRPTLLKSRQRDGLRPKFISIRSLEPLYNIPCIIRAFAEVKKLFPEAELTILGGGRLREELERLVSELRLTDVFFAGLVSNTEVPKYMAESDIFISAARTDNMPVSILEAYRAGLLVISSNVGGVPYLLRDFETGLLFEADNEAQLAERMMWAINHQNEILQMIKTAQEYVKQYEWQSVRTKLLQVYEPIQHNR